MEAIFHKGVPKIFNLRSSELIKKYVSQNLITYTELALKSYKNWGSLHSKSSKAMKHLPFNKKFDYLFLEYIAYFSILSRYEGPKVKFYKSERCYWNFTDYSFI